MQYPHLTDPNEMTRATLVLAALLLAACTRIEETEHCVVKEYGKVTEQKSGPGLRSEIGQDFVCFPGPTISQRYPAGEDEKGQPLVAQANVPTADSVRIENAQFGFTWRYTNPYLAYQDKQSHEAALLEIGASTQSGMRDFGAMITLPKLLGPERATLNEVAKAALQKQMPKYVEIDRVFVGAMEPPENIRVLWAAAMQQRGEQTKAQAQFITDSLNQRRTLLEAETKAKQVELQNRALAANPQVLAIERDKALAEASAKLLSSCTQNCFIGGDAFTRSLLQATGKP